MNWLSYLLEANLYLVAFYLLYLLLLRNETYYQLSRAYLLATSLLSFIIPLIQLGILKPTLLQSNTNATITFGKLQITGIGTTVHIWSAYDYCLLAYGMVALGFIAHFCIRIARIVLLSRKNRVKTHHDFTLIKMDGGSGAFSFFNYLFIDTNLASSLPVMYHERVHIRQKHSIDIVYTEMLKAVCWFNPVAFLLQTSIKEVHEFIADEQAAGLAMGNDNYIDLLISNAFGMPQTALTNSFFNKNLLKRRIIMLYQKRSGKTARLKYLLALPLVGGLLCLSTMAFTNKHYGLLDIAPVKTTVQPAVSNTADVVSFDQQDKGVIFTAVEVEPTPTGGMKAFYNFLGKKIMYPQADKESLREGKVIAQFIVETNGQLSGIKALRTPSKTMADEAIRVLKLCPKWIPGRQNGKVVRVEYTIPINFSLADKGDGKRESIPPPPYH